MKKLFSFMLTLVMLVACLSSTAFADELTPTVTVGTEMTAVPVTDARVIEKGEGLLRTPSQEYDLGSNGSISLSIRMVSTLRSSGTSLTCSFSI